jgi:hypothetical protein
MTDCASQLGPFPLWLMAGELQPGSRGNHDGLMRSKMGRQNVESIGCEQQHRL